MKLYVAGPMRGIDKFNFPAFDRAAADLRAAGHEITSPAEMDRADVPDFDETRNDLSNFNVEDALRRDFRVILEQDAIVLLPGWSASTGARAERFVAETTGRKVYTYSKGLSGATYLKRVDPGGPTPDGWDITAPAPRLSLGKPYYFDPETNLWYDESPPVEPVNPRYEDRPETNNGEVRVTSETGGQKGQKDVQLSLLDPGFLQELGRVFGMGAKKYDRLNFLKGYDWHLSYEAMLRHLLLWWSGEEVDEESGQSHLAHAAWHMNTLFIFHRDGLGTDTRYAR